MSRHHFDEMDRAVLLARRAATAGHIDQPATLTRILYQHWFLGRSPAQVPTPRSSRRPDQRSAPSPWRAWGPAWAGGQACRGEDLVRLFLSCAPHTSLHALSAVTEHARRWDVPWLLTSRAVGQAVPRPDATVLYLPTAALHDLRRPLAAMVADVAPFLASSVPALTLRISRGASLAQNPADGGRFGEHRCSLIADTVLKTLGLHHREVLERTFTAFRDAHVDPRRPYRALDATWEWEPRHAAA